jgi:hypothetical protein
MGLLLLAVGGSLGSIVVGVIQGRVVGLVACLSVGGGLLVNSTVVGVAIVGM